MQLHLFQCIVSEGTLCPFVPLLVMLAWLLGLESKASVLSLTLCCPHSDSCEQYSNCQTYAVIKAVENNIK